MGRQRKKTICKVTGGALASQPSPGCGCGAPLLGPVRPAVLPRTEPKPPWAPDCLCSDSRLSPSSQLLCQLDWTGLSWTLLASLFIPQLQRNAFLLIGTSERGRRTLLVCLLPAFLGMGLQVPREVAHFSKGRLQLMCRQGLVMLVQGFFRV